MEKESDQSSWEDDVISKRQHYKSVWRHDVNKLTDLATVIISSVVSLTIDADTIWDILGTGHVSYITHTINSSWRPFSWCSRSRRSF